MAEQRLVFSRSLFERRQVPARDHQQVDGRLRMEVLERDHRFVLEDDLGSRLAVNDSAEDAVHDKYSVFSSQFSVKTDS